MLNRTSKGKVFQVVVKRHGLCRCGGCKLTDKHNASETPRFNLVHCVLADPEYSKGMRMAGRRAGDRVKSLKTFGCLELS